jgi:hypothetical protein
LTPGLSPGGSSTCPARRRPGATPASVELRAKQHVTFRYKSAAHWPENFKTCHGPTNRAFAALDVPQQAALEADLVALPGGLNRGKDTRIVPSESLEVVITTSWLVSTGLPHPPCLDRKPAPSRGIGRLVNQPAPSI